MLNKILKFLRLYKTLEDKSVQQLLIDDGWIYQSIIENCYQFKKYVKVSENEKVEFTLSKVNDMFIFYVKFNVVPFNYKSFNSAPTRKEVKEIITDTVHLSSINY